MSSGSLSLLTATVSSLEENRLGLGERTDPSLSLANGAIECDHAKRRTSSGVPGESTRWTESSIRSSPRGSLNASRCRRTWHFSRSSTHTHRGRHTGQDALPINDWRSSSRIWKAFEMFKHRWKTFGWVRERLAKIVRRNSSWTFSIHWRSFCSLKDNCRSIVHYWGPWTLEIKHSLYLPELDVLRSVWGEDQRETTGEAWRSFQDDFLARTTEEEDRMTFEDKLRNCRVSWRELLHFILRNDEWSLAKKNLSDAQTHAQGSFTDQKRAKQIVGPLVSFDQLFFWPFSDTGGSCVPPHTETVDSRGDRLIRKGSERIDHVQIGFLRFDLRRNQAMFQIRGTFDQRCNSGMTLFTESMNSRKSEAMTDWRMHSLIYVLIPHSVNMPVN